MLRYLVAIEKAEHNYAAYAPDVPGCIATGKTEEEVINKIRDALAFHLEGLMEEGLPIPEPKTRKMPGFNTKNAYVQPPFPPFVTALET